MIVGASDFGEKTIVALYRNRPTMCTKFRGDIDIIVSPPLQIFGDLSLLGIDATGRIHKFAHNPLT